MAGSPVVPSSVAISTLVCTLKLLRCFLLAYLLAQDRPSRQSIPGRERTRHPQTTGPALSRQDPTCLTPVQWPAWPLPPTYMYHHPWSYIFFIQTWSTFSSLETIFEMLALCLVCGRLPGVNSLVFCNHSSVCSWPGHKEGCQSTWLLGSQTEQGWPLTVTRSEAERHMVGRRERKLLQGGPHREDGRVMSQRRSPKCWKYIQGYIRKMGKREGVPAGRQPRLNLSLSGSPSGVGSFWLRAVPVAWGGSFRSLQGMLCPQGLPLEPRDKLERTQLESPRSKLRQPWSSFLPLDFVSREVRN